MYVQNVPFEINEEGRKRALKRELDFYEGLGLSVGFVPLCSPHEALNESDEHEICLDNNDEDNLFRRRHLTVRCPFCGLVMLDVPNGDSYDYFCPECGWMA